MQLTPENLEMVETAQRNDTNACITIGVLRRGIRTKKKKIKKKFKKKFIKFLFNCTIEH